MNTLPSKTLILLSSFCLLSCGGGGGNSSGGNLSISATVGSDYAIAYKPTLLDQAIAKLIGERAIALSSGTAVDQVVAIPSTDGHYGGGMLEKMRTADIANDGSFSLSLEKSYDWVLLLVNSEATSLDEKLVSYVTTSINDDDSLVAYNSSISSKLDLGILAQDNDEARGQSQTGSFKLSLDQLTAIAKTDNGYKHMINAYLNYNSDTGIFYSVQPIFNFQAASIIQSDQTPTANTVKTYSLDTLTINVETNNLSLPQIPDDICSGSSSFGLYPPATIKDKSGNVYNASNGLTNDGIGNESNIGSSSGNWYQDDHYYCYDKDFGMQYYSSSQVPLFGFNGLQIPATGMPSGHWLLKNNASTIAEFDLGILSPLDDLGHFTVPVPAIKINYDINGVINSIDTSWFLYNTESGLYAQLTSEQIKAINSLVRDSFIEVQDENGTDTNNPETISFGEPAYSDGLVSTMDLSTASVDWYFPGSSGDVQGNLVPTFIKIGMHLSGLEYQFVWGE